MASVSFRFHQPCHRVFQPNTIPNTPYPASSFVQIELTITLDLLVVRHDCLTDQYTDSHKEFFHETVCFDIHLLGTYEGAYQILAPILTSLGIRPTDDVFDAVIDDVTHHGIRMGCLTSNWGRNVLPLRVKLFRVLEIHVNYERVLETRALEESALESNHGMIPADKSSVRKMLRRIRVEDGDKGQETNKKRKVKGEDCVICMEELKVGSTASRMPCSHVFHSICIDKWLKQSHYCPVCRFEMPI